MFMITNWRCFSFVAIGFRLLITCSPIVGKEPCFTTNKKKQLLSYQVEGTHSEYQLIYFLTTRISFLFIMYSLK